MPLSLGMDGILLTPYNGSLDKKNLPSLTGKEEESHYTTSKNKDSVYSGCTKQQTCPHKYLLEYFHGHDLVSIFACSLPNLEYLAIATLPQDLEQVKTLGTHFLRCLVDRLRGYLECLHLLSGNTDITMLTNQKINVYKQKNSSKRYRSIL